MTDRYEPGERLESSRFPGLVYARGQGEYVLLGFDINRSDLKPQHDRFLDELVAGQALATGSPHAQIDLLEGYSDSVDQPALNAELRRRRAEAVAQALLGRGVGGNWIGTVRGAVLGTYLMGNATPEERAANRSVLLRLSGVGGRTLPPVPRGDPGRPGCRRWSIQGLGNLTIGAGVGASGGTFLLRNLDTNEERTFVFAGVGVAGGIRRVPLPPRVRQILERIQGWLLPGPRPDIPTRPGFSWPSGAVRFHTSRPVWFEDFDGQLGSLVSVGVGFVAAGYGLGFVLFNAPGFQVVADEGGPFGWYQGTGMLDVGGVQAGGSGIGPEGAAVVGFWMMQ
jgi:hypothetical protein